MSVVKALSARGRSNVTTAAAPIVWKRTSRAGAAGSVTRASCAQVVRAAGKTAACVLRHHIWQLYTRRDRHETTISIRCGAGSGATVKRRGLQGRGIRAMRRLRLGLVQGRGACAAGVLASLLTPAWMETASAEAKPVTGVAAPATAVAPAGSAAAWPKTLPEARPRPRRAPIPLRRARLAATGGRARPRALHGAAGGGRRGRAARAADAPG